MEHVCSVTTATNNVYVCLVCGQFFQGRGKRTPAYTHSVQASHHVFMHLETAEVWVLPDAYQVKDASLRDIQTALRPSFTPAEVQSLDLQPVTATAMHGGAFRPGLLGVNNLGATDYLTTVVHALCRVTPFRDYFLLPSNYEGCTSSLVGAFGRLLRRLWARTGLKTSVSPHEFAHEVALASSQRFGMRERPEVVDFLTWLLNTLHRDLTKAYPKVGGKRLKPRPLPSGSPAQSIVHECFGGLVRVHTTKTPILTSAQEEALLASAAKRGGAEDIASLLAAQQASETSIADVPCLLLSLQLPPAPLFKDAAAGRRVIPQVPLFQLLGKFAGQAGQSEVKGDVRLSRRYTLARLPPFMVLHCRRFTSNQWFHEKNPIIVSLPVSGLEVKGCLRQPLPEASGPPPPSLEGAPPSAHAQPRVSPPVPLLTPAEIMDPATPTKAIIAHLKCWHPRGSSVVAAGTERSDLVPPALQVAWEGWCTKYDLVANVVHTTPPDVSAVAAQDGTGASGRAKRTQVGGGHPLTTGHYSAHVHDDASDTWYAVQDLHVQETLPQLVAVSETNLMVYRSQAWDPKRRSALARGETARALGKGWLPTAPTAEA